MTKIGVLVTNPSKTDYLDLGGMKVTGITKGGAVACQDALTLAPVLPPAGSEWIQFTCLSNGLKVESFSTIASYGVQTSLRIDGESLNALIPSVAVLSTVRLPANQYKVTYTVKNNMLSKYLSQSSFFYLTFFNSKGVPVWMEKGQTNVALLPSGSHTFTYETTTMSLGAASQVVFAQVYVVPG
jgi:hypothetical protein